MAPQLSAAKLGALILYWGPLLEALILYYIILPEFYVKTILHNIFCTSNNVG